MRRKQHLQRSQRIGNKEKRRKRDKRRSECFNDLLNYVNQSATCEKSATVTEYPTKNEIEQNEPDYDSCAHDHTFAREAPEISPLHMLL